MPAKQVSLRLGESALQALDYRCVIAHKSQAALVADLVLSASQAVQTEAGARNATFADEPDLVLNGGTIISVEEQKAWHTVRGRLAAPNGVPHRQGP